MKALIKLEAVGQQVLNALEKETGIYYNVLCTVETQKDHYQACIFVYEDKDDGEAFYVLVGNGKTLSKAMLNCCKEYKTWLKDLRD